MHSFCIRLFLLVSVASAPAQVLHFEEDLVLDPTGTDAEFGRISDVAVAPDGTIYVADWGFHQIHVFDDAGSHLRSFGQVGEAPGDLPPDLIRLGMDRDGTLVVGGQRSILSWLDAEGEPIRSVSRRDGIHRPSSIGFGHDGRIALSYAYLDFEQRDTIPTMIHVLDADGNVKGDFAECTFWDDAMQPVWAESIARGDVTADDDGHSWLHVQAQPFELRRFDLDGTLLARTTAGAGSFVGEIARPEVHGVSTTIRMTGGAGKPLVLEDGRILVHAWRTHPDDLGRDDLEGRPRSERRVFVFDAELELLGSVEAPGWLSTVDPAGRVWVQAHRPETPHLVRYRVTGD